MRWLCLIALLWPVATRAAEIMDATGRKVAVPDVIAHVLPAGPPAAVLLEALAPDLMIGWPMKPSDAARAMVAPAAAALPEVPRLTGHDDVTEAVVALKPDLIVDYGDVTPAYIALADRTQQATHIPTVLFNGALDQIPDVLRALGAALHRESRAELLAKYAADLLALPHGAVLRVVYARGADGLKVAGPGTSVTEVFARLGWQVLAPPGGGTFHQTTIADITALDPDEIVFADPTMRRVVAGSADWRALRAVREGHAYTAPALPFGWIEEPPSLNRLLGLAWLSGMDASSVAVQFASIVYGHDLSPAQALAIDDAVRPLSP
jgi:iron complex transport system substrate-binding protein